jgi:hypothetical protein
VSTAVILHEPLVRLDEYFSKDFFRQSALAKLIHSATFIDLLFHEDIYKSSTKELSSLERGSFPFLLNIFYIKSNESSLMEQEVLI